MVLVKADSLLKLVFSFCSFGYNFGSLCIALTKLIAEIWQHGQPNLTLQETHPVR